MRINKMMTKALIAILVIGVIIGSYGSVKAATGSVTFTPSSQTVKAGDTLTIVMSATCDDGISGVEASYSYDSNKLEFVTEGVTSSKWTSLGTEGLITVIDNSSEVKKSGDMFKLEFKVKDGVTPNDNIEINFTDIKLFPDGTSTAQVDIPTTQKVTVTVSNASVTPTPTPGTTPTPTPGVTPTPGATPTPSVTPASMVTPTPSGGNTGKEVVVYTDDNTTGNTSKTSTNATSNTAKSSTSTLPYTGASSIIIIGIVLVGASAIGLYFANRKYRGI